MGDRKKRKGAGLIKVGTALMALLAVLCAVDFIMASRAASPSPNPNDVELPESAAGPVDWDYWLAVNPDIVAWIEIPGTAISQPVVQARAEDPQYYLAHDVYREWNYYGCPYVDAGCEFGIDSWGATVFGHNITTPDAMFHDLENYHDADFAAAHREVIIYTPTKTKHLTVAGSRTIDGSAECKRVSFESARDFWEWRSSIMNEICSGDREEAFGQMLTLCSCSYFFNPSNERTLVYAV